MLQQDEPDDYVVATGETHSVREFCELAFERVGLDWEKYVVVDERFFRPAEVDLLVGDASKARQVLGWEPRTTFEELVNLMVDADVALLEGKLKGIALTCPSVGSRSWRGASAPPACSAGWSAWCRPAEVTAIVNMGDDMVLHGLAISPDLDTVTYTLAGAIDPERGWGLRDESWQAMDDAGALRRRDVVRAGRPRPGHPPVPHPAPGRGRGAGGGDGRDRPRLGARAAHRAGDRPAAADDDDAGRRRGDATVPPSG